MKFQFPELKFPNKLLKIWGGLAMTGGVVAAFLYAYYYPYSERYFFEKHIFFFLCFGYFLAVEWHTLLQAVQGSKNLEGGLFQRWQQLMSANHLIHITAVIPLSTIPIYATYDSIGSNLFELILAPGSYAGFGGSPDYPVLFMVYGSILVYLHIRVLAAWLTLLGLLLKPQQVILFALSIVTLAISLNFLTNSFIEMPIAISAYGDWHCEPAQSYLANQFHVNCEQYWIYRHINRIVETLEYSFYGILSGGLQFLNGIKHPVHGQWNFDLGIHQYWITGEFIRNLAAGILSPSLQFFFIMRYLKKRSFEKAKRG